VGVRRAWQTQVWPRAADACIMGTRDAFGQSGVGPARRGPSRDDRLANELATGEKVLWSGQPDNRRWLYPEDLVLLPFSILWGGFAIFWEASVLTATSAHGGTGERALFSLWGIPFVLIGMYLTLGRLFARRWIRRGSLYVVTDQRILAFSPSWTGRSRVKMIWLNSYPPLERRNGRGDLGTLCVGTMAPGQHWLGASSGWPGTSWMRGSAIVLADIPDASDVYALVAQQIAAVGRTTGAQSVEST
jgi:hypothetical protein